MKRKIWLVTVLFLLTAVIWVLWADRAVEVNEWVIESEELPDAFDGLRIAQVSDLHNADFSGRILEKLEQTEPDLIVLTGDLIDSRNTDVAIALEFAQKAAAIAPCYYVPGNHESRVPEYEDLLTGLRSCDVAVLEDRTVKLHLDGQTINLAGVRDPSFGGDFEQAVRTVTAGEGYTILLSHRPEQMELYADCGADLVFSGHAHGGQIRIPFVGGLVAPNQGFFPEYDAGLYQMDGTAMLVSRGLGNSIIPIRINNRPEIVVAVLKCA